MTSMDYLSLVQVLDSQSDLEYEALCNIGWKYLVVQSFNVRCQTGTQELGDNAAVQTVETFKLVIELVKHPYDILIPVFVFIKTAP